MSEFGSNDGYLNFDPDFSPEVDPHEYDPDLFQGDDPSRYINQPFIDEVIAPLDDDYPPTVEEERYADSRSSDFTREDGDDEGTYGVAAGAWDAPLGAANTPPAAAADVAHSRPALDEAGAYDLTIIDTEPLPNRRNPALVRRLHAARTLESRDTFDHAVAELGDDVVFVSTRHEVVEVAEYHTLVTMAEGFNRGTDRKLIVSADLDSGPDALVVAAHDPARYNLVHLRWNEGGLEAALSATQLAEALAVMTTADPAKRGQAYSFYQLLTVNLGTRHVSENGDVTLIPPTMAQMQAAVNYYANARRGETFSNPHDRLDRLTPPQRTIIDKGLIGKARRDQWGQIIADAKACFDLTFPDGRRAEGGLPWDELRRVQRDHNAPGERREGPLTTVLHISMGRSYGEQLTAMRKQLMATLLPVVKVNSPWGQPAVLRMGDADLLDPEWPEPAELFRAARRQGIRTILTVSELNDRTPPYLRRGTLGVSQVDPGTAAEVTKIAGQVERIDQSSIGLSDGTSDGVNTSGGTGDNRETVNANMPVGYSTNAGGGFNIGGSYSVADTFTRGPGPRVREDELGAVGNGRMAILAAWGSVPPQGTEGIYSVFDRIYTHPYPPSAALTAEAERIIEGARGRLEMTRDAEAKLFIHNVNAFGTDAVGGADLHTIEGQTNPAIEGRVTPPRSVLDEPGRRPVFDRAPPNEHPVVTARHWRKEHYDYAVRCRAQRHRVPSLQKFTEDTYLDELKAVRQQALELNREDRRRGVQRPQTDYFNPREWTWRAWMARRNLSRVGLKTPKWGDGFPPPEVSRIPAPRPRSRPADRRPAEGGSSSRQASAASPYNAQGGGTPSTQQAPRRGFGWPRRGQ